MARPRANGAAKPSAKGKKKAAAKKGSGIGDNSNLKVDRKALKGYIERLDNVHEEKRSTNAGFMSDIKELYQEAANALGVPRKLVRELYAEHEYERKKQEHDKEREAGESMQMDKLRLALGSYANSPLGKAAVERAERDDAEEEMDEHADA